VAHWKRHQIVILQSWARIQQYPQPTIDCQSFDGGCHLGWHFPVGCPLRGGRGDDKQWGLLFQQNQLRKKNKYAQLLYYIDIVLKLPTYLPVGPTTSRRTPRLPLVNGYGGHDDPGEVVGRGCSAPSPPCPQGLRLRHLLLLLQVPPGDALSPRTRRPRINITES
jgi:hypothetical protein